MFYVKPPSGNIRLEKFEKFGSTRLRFLEELLKSNGDSESIENLIRDINVVKHSECLIENTPEDVISHCILKICAYQNASLREIFTRAEVQLFDLRWKNLSKEEKLITLKRSRRHCLEVKARLNVKSIYYVSLLDCLQSTFKLLYDVGSHAIEETHKDVVVNVEFEHVLDLLQTREFPLHAGYMQIPLKETDRLLTSLFHTHLQHSIDLLKPLDYRQHPVYDIRIHKVIKNLKRQLSNENCEVIRHSRQPLLRHFDVEGSSKWFPSCMAHAHQLLQKTHRLNHNARIQYTLFLKEIGLPLEEALIFWEREYSKKPTCDKHTVVCSHSWNKDERRYKYGIAHMYGRKGGQKDYSAHSCKTLQSWLSNAGEQGGCPFACFDRENLTKFLVTENIMECDIEDLIIEAENKHYTSACLKHWKKKMEWHFLQLSKEATVENPVKKSCLEFTLESNSFSKSCENTPRTRHITLADEHPGTSDKVVASCDKNPEKMKFNLVKPSDYYRAFLVFK